MIGRYQRQLYLVVSILIFLVACRPAPEPAPTFAPRAATVTPTTSPEQLPTTTVPVASSATSPPPPTVTPLPPPTLTFQPTVAPTADPYTGWTIADLRRRTYGQGNIQVLKTMAVTQAFTRSLIAYPSDGLTIQGFMDTPRAGRGPYPVILVNHGYIDPARYSTLAYTTRYADAFARAGYLVIHPNYRDYGGSDSGPNPFRVGYAIDVLNLVELVRKLPQANAKAIGLFGHSMGGGISIRAMTVSPNVRAVLLYGAMSGDEQANFEKIRIWRGVADLPELHASESDLERLSPIYYLNDVTAAVSIHHGAADGTVPPEWSADLYQRLQALGKKVEYFTYPGAPHTFRGADDSLLIQRAIRFFDRWLKRET